MKQDTPEASPFAQTLLSAQSVLSLEQAKLHAQTQALQVLAHSSAVAIQDAVAHMRNMNTINATAVGSALAQMLATGDVQSYAQVIEQANAMQANSISHFKSIAEAASSLLRNLPNVENKPSETPEFPSN
ncbi:hypothetical protein RF679_01300 [Undibacterium cyanobacteriorum]|uniref:Phasin domain-containing protein n=1 Tax=Undibacterium cyanobacteriorum TaxID=3073561 RepID=A0ABY9RI80_9BURK|nr:hypothetical protein [Undibacterium sp. 20NA77.5]WMW80932.1 hypothetical protein RF679_01300 [Undibacterium sp. 20NA77.5]